ncbi:MAG TPA: ATP-binding protein [Tissierellaceae bacterium]|nr:ATP-binding protein [Tissierellaceae bacterium]
MKRRIHLNVSLLSTAITLLVAFFMIFTFYKFNRSNQMDSLKSTGNLISNLVISSEVEELDKLNLDGNDIRITLIDFDGLVLFDNKADLEIIENHLNRTEVQEAIEKGSGESIRYSTTLGYDTYYYAIMLEDNLILRVSHEADNLFTMFSEIIPIIILMLVLIFIITYYVSSLLAKRILKPIDIFTRNLDGNINEGDLRELSIYDEFTPFIRTYESQSKEINARNIELEEKANLLDVISSSMGEGIILLDINKKIISINKSSIRLFNGYQDFSYTGNDFIRLCRNIDLNQVLENSIEDKSSNEILINHNNKYLNIYINPVLRDSKLTGLLLLVVDTTEKHKLDMMRKEFSANVSHELKTPLTSINGYAEMIKNGMAKGDDVTKFASIIKREGERLLNLIDDIIKLSRIEDGSKENKLEPINLYSLGKDAISSLDILAQEKDINLSLKGRNLFMIGNKGMLQDLLYNLLENSIKYTNPGGSIKLIIDEDKANTIIKIVDTGIGIPPEHQDRIFERFYIVDKSRSKKTESTGLGLSIVKHIVEYHKGKIDLKSELGKGTEITIRF